MRGHTLSFDRKLAVTYSWTDLVTVTLLALLVSLWAAVAAGGHSWTVFLACGGTFLSFYLAGSLFSAWQHLTEGMLFDLPLRLLLGYGLVSTLLLVAAWLSPWGFLANFALIVAALLIIGALWASPRRVPGNPATVVVVALSAVSATLWCQDSISPTADMGEHVLFKPWVDGFYHAVHIRIFSESHGGSTIEDFRMVGEPARLYHYGVYMLPAVIKAASNIHSYAAFAGILAPFGVLLTGLSAYALIGSLWGKWAGVLATVALLLLPDGAEQGMQNPFMSYHWLTQISPSATYGLALLGVAWTFVLRGCAGGNFLQLLFGWVVALVLAAFKLHFVVASGLLLLLVPALFFRARWSAPKRTVLGVAAFGSYGFALLFGQRVPGVPVIRFDGSSNGEILRLIQSFVRPGQHKDLLESLMGPEVQWTSNILFGVPYVLLTVFGITLLLLILLLWTQRDRLTLLEKAFPALLLLNFVSMFFGLALDFESSTPDELSHRPLMIVYFFVCAWVGGLLGLSLVRSARWSSRAPLVALTLGGLLLAVPAHFGPGVQQMWVMSKISPVKMPKPVLEVAEYLRTHGTSEDVFQDTQFDRVYAIAALAERRTFVAHTLTRMPFKQDLISARTVAINRIMAMKQPKLVVGTMRAYGIRWFIVPWGNRLRWPEELAAHPVFQSGPLSVYDFGGH